jgi:hypothetical protein
MPKNCAVVMGGETLAHLLHNELLCGVHEVVCSDNNSFFYFLDHTYMELSGFTDPHLLHNELLCGVHEVVCSNTHHS